MTDPIPSEIRCAYCDKKGRDQHGDIVRATIEDRWVCGHNSSTESTEECEWYGKPLGEHAILKFSWGTRCIKCKKEWHRPPSSTEIRSEGCIG